MRCKFAPRGGGGVGCNAQVQGALERQGLPDAADAITVVMLLHLCTRAEGLQGAERCVERDGSAPGDGPEPPRQAHPGAQFVWQFDH